MIEERTNAAIAQACHPQLMRTDSSIIPTYILTPIVTWDWGLGCQEHHVADQELPSVLPGEGRSVWWRSDHCGEEQIFGR